MRRGMARGGDTDDDEGKGEEEERKGRSKGVRRARIRRLMLRRGG